MCLLVEWPDQTVISATPKLLLAGERSFAFVSACFNLLDALSLSIGSNGWHPRQFPESGIQTEQFEHISVNVPLLASV